MKILAKLVLIPPLFFAIVPRHWVVFRRCGTASLSPFLKVYCIMIVFFGRSTLEDGTTTLHRIVGHHSPNEATQYRRRMEVSTASQWMLENLKKKKSLRSVRTDEMTKQCNYNSPLLEQGELSDVRDFVSYINIWHWHWHWHRIRVSE
jgi:hypothetical protein